ncbi:MAG: hypothetical protein COB56_05145 [Robiginitomaculum sp.]|nr:MAG: hypothetical protein COB56_05145 [Robiginitomaculum sp.]
MTFNVFLAFAAFCFVSSATPGPNNLMLMASGANFGIRRTVPHWLGIGIGFTVMVIVVGLGLMNVFEMFPVIYKILKTLSVAFLIYLAWKIANAAPLGETGTVGQPMTFLQAVAFQWVNPKAWAMALTAISVYSPSNSVAAVVTTALIFGLINLPSCSIWMFVGRQIHRFLTNPLRMRVFNIVMSLLLLTSLYPLLFSAH